MNNAYNPFMAGPDVGGALGGLKDKILQMILLSKYMGGNKPQAGPPSPQGFTPTGPYQYDSSYSDNWKPPVSPSNQMDRGMDLETVLSAVLKAIGGGQKVGGAF
jgi:hypothetical protein